MKWNEKAIEEELNKFIVEMGINRMPTHTEFRESNHSGLSRAILKYGGTEYWSNKLNLKKKDKVLKWNDQKIDEEIKQSIKVLQIQRMPTASELKSINKNDLHCAISKSGIKYSGWAKKLGLELKSSETKMGVEHEYIVKQYLESYFSNELIVEKMTSGHPYDLLINGCVKIDVKVSSPHIQNTSRVHTFGINKEYATCDIYICIALNEDEEIEKTFIIPSPHLKLVTLCVGKNSKYNKYINNWQFISDFAKVYENAII